MQIPYFVGFILLVSLQSVPGLARGKITWCRGAPAAPTLLIVTKRDEHLALLFMPTTITSHAAGALSFMDESHWPLNPKPETRVWIGEELWKNF